jgi:hypothetical protein
VCAWGIPNHEPLQRLSSIRIPDLVANDDSDPVPSRQHASRRTARPSWASGFAIGSFFAACAGQDLAGSSADGAEARITSVGRRGRLIQSQSHQVPVISHGEIPRRAGTLLVRQFVSQGPGSSMHWI